MTFRSGRGEISPATRHVPRCRPRGRARSGGWSGEGRRRGVDAAGDPGVTEPFDATDGGAHIDRTARRDSCQRGQGRRDPSATSTASSTALARDEGSARSFRKGALEVGVANDGSAVSIGLSPRHGRAARARYDASAQQRAAVVAPTEGRDCLGGRRHPDRRWRAWSGERRSRRGTEQRARGSVRLAAFSLCRGVSSTGFHGEQFEARLLRLGMCVPVRCARRRLLALLGTALGHVMGLMGIVCWPDRRQHGIDSSTAPTNCGEGRGKLDALVEAAGARRTIIMTER